AHILSTFTSDLLVLFKNLNGKFDPPFLAKPILPTSTPESGEYFFTFLTNGRDDKMSRQRQKTKCTRSMALS
ncbi:hypothetical protein SUGI_0862360, partial [Cryptomeria japonica]